MPAVSVARRSRPDIVEWVRLRDTPFITEALAVDGDTVLEARQYAVWDVVLSCGHFAQEHITPGWKPEDGHVPRECESRRPLDEVKVVAQGDPAEEAYWRRRYEENHPDPTPFTRCHTCACIRTITAYQRVGWLVPKKKAAPTPAPVARKTLERRLRKLETEAAKLRQQLGALPDDR